MNLGQCSSQQAQGAGTVRLAKGRATLAPDAGATRCAPGRSGARAAAPGPQADHAERAERLSGQKKMFFRQSPVLIWNRSKQNLDAAMRESIAESDDCLKQQESKTKERNRPSGLGPSSCRFKRPRYNHTHSRRVVGVLEN